MCELLYFILLKNRSSQSVNRVSMSSAPRSRYPSCVHLVSVLHVSTGFTSSDESEDHSISMLRLFLLHAVLTSRVDYCNTVLAAAPKSVTDKIATCLVCNAAARIVSGKREYDRGLSDLLYTERWYPPIHSFNWWLVSCVPSTQVFSTNINKKLCYRKRTVRMLHSIEISATLHSRSVEAGISLSRCYCDEKCTRVDIHNVRLFPVPVELTFTQ